MTLGPGHGERGPTPIRPGAMVASARVKTWCVYIARCGDGTLYTGVTNDLPRRIERHNRGRGAAYTRARRPIELVYDEPANGRGAALRREAQLKRLSRAQKLALIARLRLRTAEACAAGCLAQPRESTVDSRQWGRRTRPGELDSTASTSGPRGL